jgi:hypothetical protein
MVRLLTGNRVNSRTLLSGPRGGGSTSNGRLNGKAIRFSCFDNTPVISSGTPLCRLHTGSCELGLSGVTPQPTDSIRLVESTVGTVSLCSDLPPLLTHPGTAKTRIGMQIDKMRKKDRGGALRRFGS